MSKSAFRSTNHNAIIAPYLLGEEVQRPKSGSTKNKVKKYKVKNYNTEEEREKIKKEVLTLKKKIEMCEIELGACNANPEDTRFYRGRLRSLRKDLEIYPEEFVHISN